MITLSVDMAQVKGQALLFGFSLESGSLTSVALVPRKTSNKPGLSGWLKGAYPEDSSTEEFKLADAYAYLAVHAPGWGQLKKAIFSFNDNGKLVKVEAV